MIDELVAFLRARLKEDERTARAVMWDGSGNTPTWDTPFSSTVEVGTDCFDTYDRTVANHIVEWDPARVLREVDAGRQAIAHYERVAAHRWKHLDYELAVGAVEVQLKIRALPHAGHPDYRQEWKP